MQRRTKIVCTLGPATDEPDTIRDLIRAGMDVVRLNLSHGTHEYHQRLIDRVREAASAESCVIPVLLDLQGPKIRVGDMTDGCVTLQAGQTVALTYSMIEYGTADRFHVGYPTLLEDVSVGRQILLDDGRLELIVRRIEEQDVIAEVIVGGPLSSRKGVNLPDIRTTTPSLTQKDLDDLEFGLRNNVDLIALSFVRDETDVRDLTDRLTDAKKRPAVIAKIEKPEAVDRIDPILEIADGIMVARGDLGIEMRLSRVPSAQKNLIRKCLAAAKPVITATQMLESMIDHPRPTRAEVSDVANAVLDGSDALMLSGETAIGKYPVRAVEVMANVIEEAELHRIRQAGRPELVYTGITEAVSRTAANLASQVGARAIVCLTASGATARSIARHRPEVPVYAFTDDEHIVGQLALTWGTKGFHIPFQCDTDRGITAVHEVLMDHGLVKKGDLIIVTAGMPLPAKGRTNMVHVSRV